MLEICQNFVKLTFLKNVADLTNFIVNFMSFYSNFVNWRSQTRQKLLY